MEKNDQEKQALVSSLRLLAATAKSRSALKRKLEEKGFREEVVQKVLSRLEKEGLLNDRALAVGLFQSFLGRRRSGRKRIAFELEKRGIRDVLVEEVLQGYTPEQEREQALELAKDKWERWLKIERLKRRKKVYDFLVRRGFEFEMCRSVVNEVVRESQS
jgi:regulatory protein